MDLPNEFYECMRNTLRADYDEYINCLDAEPYRGLRVNTIKISCERLKDLVNIKMKNTPFCDEGFYIDNNISGLGNHPLHHAGAFYLQEPSAMSAVSALDVKKGDKVLDLCAAPGGKSTQIASALNGEGLLWSNEIVMSRAKILYSNIERMGIKNAVVSSSHPDILCNELAGYFDKVLVDAPCSGEGMIRRESNAVTEWKAENRIMCADRQLKIMESAAKAVKQDGVLVYSTCTLSGEENELVINQFLQTHSDFKLDKINKEFGRAAYTHFCDNEKITLARRILYPDGGEGHFVARLIKTSYEACNVTDFKIKSPTERKVFDEFYGDNFNEYDEQQAYGNISEINGNIVILPSCMPQTKGIHILKAGVLAGRVIKNRFVPEHDLYMSRQFNEFKNVLNLKLEDDRCSQFLRGFEIECENQNYCGVAVEGIITGFGKASNGVLKNHYPKGLRILK